MSVLPDGTGVGPRYQIRNSLHEMPGYVAYTAFDHEVEVDVALWMIRPELVPNAAVRDRFLAGAAHARQLNHPNARRIFDAGAADVGCFVVVQPAPGEGLRARLDAGGGARAPELLQVAAALCDALGAAHQSGMIHGRLLPEDVMQVAGLIKVGGIGLWRLVDPSAAAYFWRTRERYLAPEVRTVAHEGSPQADVYSIAIVLAELASGTPAHDVAALLGGLGQRLPTLATALANGLQVAPMRRYESPARLLDALRRVLIDDRVPTGPQPATAPTGPGKPPGDSQPYGKRSGKWGHSDVKLRASRETQPEPHEETTRTDGPAIGMGPPPPVIQQVPGAPPPPVLQFKSMKPLSEPGKKRTPLVAAIDRPEMQPVLRSIASSAPAGTVPPVQMGYYAPPRVAGAPAAGPPARSTGWGKVALLGLLGAAVLGVGVWFALTRLVRGDEPTAARPETPARPARPREPVVVSPHPGGAAGPCPEAMATVGEGTGRFCIDQHESPGQGRLPQTGVSLTEAETACGMRGARLCSESEWEQACRGEGSASWPYGDTYRGEPCNTDTGKMGVIAVGGAFPDCKSAVGAFDMSGNVAEWVSGEITKGSSALDRGDGRCSSKKPRSGARGYSDVGFRCCNDPR